MKIAIVVEEFNSNKGYLEYYLAKELTKLGHEVFVLTFNLSKRILRTTHKEGFEVVSFPYIASANGLHIPSVRGAAYLVNFIKKERLEIIHCQPLYSPL